MSCVWTTSGQASRTSRRSFPLMNIGPAMCPLNYFKSIRALVWRPKIWKPAFQKDSRVCGFEASPKFLEFEVPSKISMTISTSSGILKEELETSVFQGRIWAVYSKLGLTWVDRLDPGPFVRAILGYFPSSARRSKDFWRKPMNNYFSNQMPVLISSVLVIFLLFVLKINHHIGFHMIESTPKR